MKRALGIDLGDVRVGVAISDELKFLAHPVETIDVRRTAAITRICELAAARDVDIIVVGMPRNMDGSRGLSAEKALSFVESLRIALADFSTRVVTWDERLTTVSAQRSLREAGRKAHEQKNIIDQAAAQVILQGWLDAQAGGLSAL
ncbi:MAG: Holliday junction resolvase RuvX [Terrimicrobiaceae bacterium]|nr:Holliday junction resolvase RuvX [Terrimicrobiaceae bacterium]